VHEEALRLELDVGDVQRDELGAAARARPPECQESAVSQPDEVLVERRDECRELVVAHREALPGSLRPSAET
jgi:hypothetical protein